MEARSTTDRSQWDGFLAAQPETPFLQSWAWGMFQEALGRRVVRLGIADGSRLLGVLQAVYVRLPLGFSALAISRGPVLDRTLPMAQYRDVLTTLVRAVQEAARAERVTLLRILPAAQRGTPIAALLEQSMPQNARRILPTEPADSLLLDLAPPLEEVRAAAHPKTRYNIGLAERHGVSVERHVAQVPIGALMRLLHATAYRDHIRLHPDAYYRAMVATLTEEDVGAVWTAAHNGTMIAANIVLHVGDTVTYLHGASSNEHRHLMASHLLQWHQIRWAREHGARWYDFWGVAPDDAGERHAWAGITRFKRGFGGEARHYLPGIEVPMRPFRYRCFRLLKRLRP